MSSFTHIQIYSRNSNGIRLLMGLGIFLALLGVTGLIYYWLFGKFIFYAVSFWQNIFLIIQGLITVYISWSALKSRRYFISWNENEIQYLIPKNKHTETIKICDIHSVAIDTREVVISLNNQEERRVNLNYLFLPKRNQVLEYFKKLKERIDGEMYT